MGNCISFRRASGIDDEEQNNLVKGTAFEAQEDALVMANERLRVCDADIQASRDEVTKLRERVEHGEQAKKALDIEKEEGEARLKSITGDLADCRDTLKSAQGTITRLERKVQQLADERVASDSAKREKIAELEASLTSKYEQLLSQRIAYEHAMEENKELGEMMRLIKVFATTFFDDTFRLSEETMWRTEAEHLRNCSDVEVGKKTVGIAELPALLEMERSKYALAEDISSLRGDLQIAQAAKEIESEDLAELHERNQGLEKQLAEAQSRINVSALESRDSTASYISDRTYDQPHRFSRTIDKDLRVSVGSWKGQLRVDVREFYGGKESRKGISIPVKDAARLARVLPDVVRKARTMLER